jgi:hypothetical protein
MPVAFRSATVLPLALSLPTLPPLHNVSAHFGPRQSVHHSLAAIFRRRLVPYGVRRSQCPLLTGRAVDHTL